MLTDFWHCEHPGTLTLRTSFSMASSDRVFRASRCATGRGPDQEFYPTSGQIPKNLGILPCHLPGGSNPQKFFKATCVVGSNPCPKSRNSTRHQVERIPTSGVWSDRVSPEAPEISRSVSAGPLLIIIVGSVRETLGARGARIERDPCVCRQRRCCARRRSCSGPTCGACTTYSCCRRPSRTEAWRIPASPSSRPRCS